MNGNEGTFRKPGSRFQVLVFAWLLAAAMPVLGAIETDLSKGGISLCVTASPDSVDVARDFEVVVKAVAPAGIELSLPDLRDRFRGFSVAEDFAEDPVAGEDGSITYVSSWRLVPKPCEKSYKLLPFVVTIVRKTAAGETAESFYTSSVYFRNPAAREPVTGAMEIAPEKDMPPLSWRLAGLCALVLAAVCAAVALVWWAAKKVRQKIREHRMSPIERAMLELDRLLKKGLPGRGRYKDFYVELTMVVRRYIQRRYSVRAPNLTTDEFLRAASGNPAFTRDAIEGLRQFLESSDMVKFAGIEATPEMADSATDRARDYLNADSRNGQSGGNL